MAWHSVAILSASAILVQAWCDLKVCFANLWIATYDHACPECNGIDTAIPGFIRRIAYLSNNGTAYRFSKIAITFWSLGCHQLPSCVIQTLLENVRPWGICTCCRGGTTTLDDKELVTVLEICWHPLTNWIMILEQFLNTFGVWSTFAEIFASRMDLKWEWDTDNVCRHI